MAPEKLQSSAWALAREQHGVITRAQLVDLGYGSEAIRHRVRKGRLHRVQIGVYAVGRPEVSQLGGWLAAVLSCGPGALLSHESAAVLWGIRRSASRASLRFPCPTEWSAAGRESWSIAAAGSAKRTP